MSKVYLLRRVGDIHEMGDKVVHFHGCPYYGPNEHNLDKAKTFKTAAAARSTTAFKHDGYEVVEAEVTIKLIEG